MDTLLEFFLDNYIWVLIVSLIVIFALIGYLVDVSSGSDKKDKKKKKGVTPIEVVRDDKRVVHPSVEAYTNEDFDAPLMDEKNS